MDMFAALADPNRRGILEMLAHDGQLPVAVIASRFDVSTPAISQHLKILREARLVRVQKRAQQRLYSVNTDAMREFEAWARRMAGMYEERYSRLERLLKEQEAREVAQSKRTNGKRIKREGH